MLHFFLIVCHHLDAIFIAIERLNIIASDVVKLCNQQSRGADPLAKTLIAFVVALRKCATGRRSRCVTQVQQH